jgi:hypothetical protein
LFGEEAQCLSPEG